MPPIENVDSVMAEMEEEIKASGEDRGGVKPELQEKRLPKEDDEAGDDEADKDAKDEDDKGSAAVDEEEEDDDKDLALVSSEDLKKRNGVFGKYRKETKELKAAVEQERQEKAELRERLAKLEGRWEGSGPRTEAKVEQDQEPDRILYPDDHRDWQTRQMEKRVEAAEKRAEAAQQWQAASAEERAVDALEAQYRSANPKEGYDEAVKFLWDKEKANIKLLRPNLTDSQIDLQIKADKVMLFKTLHGQGVANPSATLVQMAKNYGWKAGGALGGKKDVDLDKLADTQRRTSNLIGGSPASKDRKGTSSDDVLNMSLKKAMRVASTNPSAFDGDFGE